MSKLDKVVPNFLIGESFVGLCKFDEMIVQGLEGLVLRGVGSGLIGVVF